VDPLERAEAHLDAEEKARAPVQAQVQKVVRELHSRGHLNALLLQEHVHARELGRQEGHDNGYAAGYHDGLHDRLDTHRGPMAAAVAFLTEALASGGVDVNELKRAIGSRPDVSWSTVRRAAQAMGIVKAGRRPSVWSLPARVPKVPT
jgi:hypothetical protein